jgi:transmembrane sensor
VFVLPRNESEARSVATKLEVGQQLAVPGAGRPRIEAANLEGVLAWQSRQIIFDDEPLATAVERINRYSSDRLILADEQTGGLRISGVFRTDDLAGFVDTLTRYLPVQSERRHNAIVLRARRQQPPPQTASRVEGFRRQGSHSLI